MGKKVLLAFFASPESYVDKYPSLTVSFSPFVIPAPLILCSWLPNGNPAVSLVLQREGCQGHSAKQ